MATNQSEKFWSKTAAHAAPAPGFRVAAPKPDAVFDAQASARRTLDPSDPVAWNVAHGRTVMRDSDGTLIETTTPPPAPRAPEPAPPGLKRVQSLVDAQGERARSAYVRTAEALVRATAKRDEIATAVARDPFAHASDALEAAERERSLSQLTAAAAETEWRRVGLLQKTASADLRYDRLAQLETQQSDESWALEKVALAQAASEAAKALGALLTQQRQRAEEVAQARSAARAIARGVELDWQAARHDAHDRQLLVAHAFRKGLIEAGLSVGEVASLTRG